MNEIVDTFIGVCLRFLVDKGFVMEQQIQGKWYSRDASARLEEQSFAAAASIDNAGRPVVMYNSKIPDKAIVYSIPHESIHLAQICKGDLEPLKGTSLWKGKVYENLLADNPNYFTDQPWEAEARNLENDVRAALLNKYPELEDHLAVSNKA